MELQDIWLYVGDHTIMAIWVIKIFFVRHYKLYLEKKITVHRGIFPGGPVVKNLPSSAGDMGSIPGGGTKIPHAEGQLGPLDNNY